MLKLMEELAAMDQKMESESMYEEALFDLRSLIIWHENNVEVAWRLAKACFKNASGLTDTKKQEVLAQEGIKCCERFLEQEHADLHKWYALLVGLRTEYLPTKEKLVGGKLFEKHVRIALALRPTDPTLSYLLGRFQFTVSGLSWFEKKVCETLFGEAPTSTYQEAIETLEKAEEYASAPDIENKFFLGQAYLKIKEYKKGVNLLRQVCDLKASNDKQEKMKIEANKLVSKNSSYC